MSIKKYFFTGLMVWLPLAITLWVLNWLLQTLDGVSHSLLAGLSALTSDATATAIARALAIPGVGIAVVLLFVIVTGALVSNVAGRWWLKQWDLLITRIPVFRSVYNSVN
jgi:uncharacterized membrane protein